MKRSLLSTAVAAASLSLISSVAIAGGLDRSGQDTSILHKEGNLFEITSVSVKPDVSGTYDTTLTTLGGGTSATGDVTPDYSMTTVGFKMDVSEDVAVAVVNDSPYGAHVNWTGGFLNGTEGVVSSNATTAMASYALDGGMSVYGGIKSQSLSVQADISLPFNGANGIPSLAYELDKTSSSATGYLLGAAFEKPEIAMRIALTYHPKVKHTFTVVESVNGAPSSLLPGNVATESVYAPSAINLDFQTGVAENTLLFGSIRKVNWSETEFRPYGYDFATRSGGAGTGSYGDGKALLSYDEDTVTYNIGLGRKFTETWSGAVTYGYEGRGDSLGSPLSPTNGNSKYGVGVTYNAEEFSATLAVQKINLGDQTADVGGVAAAMADNDALVTAVKISAKF